MSAAARYTARWVLPVTAPPIEDGAVVVDDDGRITGVGPAVSTTAPLGTPNVDLGFAALLPGLVDTHIHPELTAFRGLLEDLRFPAWIGELVRVRRAADPTSDELAASALLGCAEALAAGITTLAATEDSSATLAALLALGMRGVVFREVFGPDPREAADALARLRAAIDAMRVRETDLVRIGISPHAPYTVSDALYRLAAAYATEEALPMAVHAAEALAERQLVVAGAGPFAHRLRQRGIATPARGASTIALLDRLGVLALRPLLIHCVRLDRTDIERIAAAGAAVAHCPAANARLGHGIAPVLDLEAAGVCVALGSDSVASNNRVDMLEEARLAQLMQRARRRRGTILPADQLLRMATLEGARALGLDHRVGSLEAGKDADLCAIDLGSLHASPVHDPVVALFHSARASDIVLTAVRGRVLYRSSAFTDLDLPNIRNAVAKLADRLRAARRSAERGS